MTEPVLDLEDVLYRIQGDKGLLIELIDMFLEDTPHRLQEIAQCLATTDCSALADMAHALKGASGNIGAKQLHSVFKSLEESAKQQNLSLFREQFDQAILVFRSFQDHAPAIKTQLAC